MYQTRTCSQDHDICLKEASIRKSDPGFLERFHVLTLLDVDLTVDDQGGAPKVDMETLDESCNKFQSSKVVRTYLPLDVENTGTMIQGRLFLSS